MNNTWRVMSSAIKASLFNIPISLPEDIDWDDIFMESKKQAVSSIIRDGMQSQLPQSLATEWKLYSIQDISYTVQLVEAQKELCSLLEKNGIKYVILKGTAASIYYPEPYFRSMGDVDFWVPREQFATTLDLLKASGYIELENNDEREIKLRKDGILFELHTRVSNSDDDKALDSYVEKAELVRGRTRDTEFWMLPEMENGLVLINHLRQHLIEGLGIRQVLDWMMYCDRVLDAEKWRKMLPEIRELNLEKLAITVTHMCVMYFGLKADWCAGGEAVLSDLLLANIIQSGNFGKAHGIGRNVERVYVNIKKKGLFRYIQQAGEANWKSTLNKHPYLRPFAWLYQMFRYIRQVKDSGRKGKILKDDLKRSNERYKLLKALELL